MANLSAELQAAGSGASIINEPGGGGSPLATGVGSIARGLDTLGTLFAQRAAGKRQQAAEARSEQEFSWKVEDHNANNAAAQSLNQLNSLASQGGTVATTSDNPIEGLNPLNNDLTIPDDVLKQVDQGAGQLSRYQTGVEQRKVSPLALNATANKLFNQILNDNPNIGAGALAKAFKDRGVNAFSAYETIQDDEKAKASAKQDEWKKAYQAGIENNPMAKEGGATDDEVAQAGRIYLHDQAVLQATRASAAEARAQASETRTDTTFTKTQNADDAVGAAQAEISSAAEGILKQWQQYAVGGPERGSNAGYETQRAKIEAQLPQYFSNLIARTTNRMAAQGYGGDAIAKVQAQLQSYVKSTYTDPIAQGNAAWANATSTITSSFGLRMREAAPLVYQMKALGLDPGQIPELMNAIDPTVKQRIGAQIQGIMKDGLVNDVEKQRLVTSIAVLKGQANVSELGTTADKRFIMQTAGTYVQQNARNVAAGKGDPEGYMNMKRQTALGASGVNAQSGADTILKATQLLAPDGAIDAGNTLRANKAHHEEAALLGSAERAAAAHLLPAALSALKGTGQSGTTRFYDLHYEGTTGQYSLQFNQQRWDRANPNQDRGGSRSSNYGFTGTTTQPRPEPSDDAKKLLQAVNGNIAFLTKTSSWDDSGPKGNFREIAAYWGTGRPTSDMQKQQQGKAGKGDVMNIGNTLLDELTHVPEMGTVAKGDYSNVPFDQVHHQITAKESGGNPDSVVYGLKSPQPLTSMTMGQVHDFQLNTLRPQTRGKRGDGDVGSTGVGSYQFESGTLQQNAQEVFGDNWRSTPFTAANQRKVAEHLYNKVRGNRTALSNTWAAFS
jgi:hypothetical protein